MSVFLILLAAGDSKRLKSSIPKQYQKIEGKTLLEHNICIFNSFKKIKKIIIVYNKKHQKYLNNLDFKNTIKIIGGKTRQKSTLIGLKKIRRMNCKKVLIHDSARPNPPKKMIAKILFNLKNNHAVIPTIKVADATKRIKNKFIFKSIKRNSLRFAQTPQGFTYKKILDKHLKNVRYTFDDDASLFTNNKEKVFTINGSKQNIKITDQEDLNIFKSLKKKKNYFGIGFDVHRLVPKRKLYIGGVRVKSNLGTLGHSDGDPVLHSITDALLGACGMGDIGEKFSNKNKKFKNVRSTFFLKKVVQQTEMKGFFINNIDINIIIQKPKLQKYKKKMLDSISKLCKITQKKINIKGKTTEKLGVIGKEKAIASEAIISVYKND